MKRGKKKEQVENDGGQVKWVKDDDYIDVGGCLDSDACFDVGAV